MDKARIASLLRNNGWALDLLVIVLCAYFCAGTLNAVLARAIRPVPTVEDTLAPSASAPTRAAIRVPLRELAERNLLALKRESLAPVAGGSDGAPEQPQADLTLKTFRESDLKPCTIAGVLRGTLVADNPELSLAVVVRNDTREPAAYSIKEGSNMIADDAVLVAVRSREIVVRRPDHFERCDGEGELPGAPQVNTIVPVNADGPPGNSQEVTGVTKLSATDYKVERAEVDRALSNLNEVATQARIVPSLKNGKPNGFKMFAIKPGSIYSKIGLQNGDVIQKINGYDMNSPDRALEIYTKLRDATSLSIELQRGGNTQTMNYAIN